MALRYVASVDCDLRSYVHASVGQVGMRNVAHTFVEETFRGKVLQIMVLGRINGAYHVLVVAPEPYVTESFDLYTADATEANELFMDPESLRQRIFGG